MYEFYPFLFNLGLIYISRAKTKIQASKGKSKDELSMLAVLLRIFKNEGVFGFYRGFWATMLNTFSMRMYCLFPRRLCAKRIAEYAYFFFYSFVRNSYINRLMRKLPPGSALPALSTAAELLIGAIAGGLAQIFTIPVSVIATRQQVGREKPTTAEAAVGDDSFLGVAREIIDEEGVGGLWLGIKPGLVLTVNPAITYGVFERVKGLLIAAQVKAGSNDKIAPGLSFVVGALSKTLATVVRTSDLIIPFALN